MLIIMIRTVILYLIVIAMMRLMGKKQLGELQPGELVTTILISNIATMSIEDPAVPMLIGIAPILTIVCIDVFVSVLTLKLPRLRTVIAGHPKVIISDGVIDRRVLGELRYTIDDVLTAMRSESIFDINEVRWAIVETTGKISFCKKADYPSDPPAVVIRDGVTERSGMEQSGLDGAGLNRLLRENSVAAGDVFLLTASKDGTFTLIRKAGVKNG